MFNHNNLISIHSNKILNASYLDSCVFATCEASPVTIPVSDCSVSPRGPHLHPAHLRHPDNGHDDDKVDKMMVIGKDLCWP